MTQRECTFGTEIILNGLTGKSEAPLKLSLSPDCESGLFTFQPE